MNKLDSIVDASKQSIGLTVLLCEQALVPIFPPTPGMNADRSPTPGMNADRSPKPGISRSVLGLVGLVTTLTKNAS